MKKKSLFEKSLNPDKKKYIDDLFYAIINSKTEEFLNENPTTLKVRYLIDSNKEFFRGKRVLRFRYAYKNQLEPEMEIIAIKLKLKKNYSSDFNPRKHSYTIALELNERGTSTVITAIGRRKFYDFLFNKKET